MWHGKRAGKERDLNMRDKHYERILEKQLAMNRQTWAALERRGATEDSELRLDFFFYAPIVKPQSSFTLSSTSKQITM